MSFERRYWLLKPRGSSSITHHPGEWVAARVPRGRTRAAARSQKGERAPACTLNLITQQSRGGYNAQMNTNVKSEE